MNRDLLQSSVTFECKGGLQVFLVCSGIAAHIVLEDGQDGCLVGLLKRQMKAKHKQLEGVTAHVICVLTTNSTSTPMACDRAFVHHNKGSCKVVCTGK